MAETILVLVTGQKSGSRLIHKGAEMAAQHDAQLLVLSVSGSGLNTLTNPSVIQALDELYQQSCEVGAEMTMLHAADVRKAICDFIKVRSVTRVILGQSRESSSAFITQLMRSLPQIAFTIEPSA